MEELRSDEQIEDLQRKGYRIIQKRNGYRFGQDAVLLSWFASVRPGEKVMDLCTGSGIVPILMHARSGTGDYTGLELQADMADMAERSVRLNGIAGQVRIVCGDLNEAETLFPAASFQAVTVNPPYMKANTGIPNPDPTLALARHEVACTLEQVISVSSRLLCERGRFYMVNRISRLAEALGLLRRFRMAPSVLRLVYPFRDRPAKLFLISAVKGGHDILSAEPPLFVFDAPGVYTEEISRIYWEA